METELENKFWNLRNSLRGQIENSVLYQIIAVSVLISHENRNILKPLMQEDVKKSEQVFLKEIEKNGINFSSFNVREIFQLKNISQNQLLEIYKFILEVKPEYDAELIKLLVDNEFVSTPISVNRIMVNLADINSSTSILDPTFGLGVTFDEVLKRNLKQKIVGQEINPKIFDLAKIRLYCLNATNIQLYMGDSISEPEFLKDGEKFDRVITNAPFGVKGNPNIWEALKKDSYGRFNYGLPSKTSLDWAFIMTGLSGLKENGKAIFSVTNSALFMGSQVKKIRNNFLAADLIEAVIALPVGLFSPHTNIPTAILVINRKKKRLINTVRMINATSFPVSKDKSTMVLSEESIDKIIKAYRNDEDIKGFVKNVSTDEIKRQDAVLLPERYVKDLSYKINSNSMVEIKIDKLKETDTVNLNEISEIFRGFNATSKDETDKGSYEFVKISDLNNYEVNFNKLSKGTVKENTRAENYQIQSGDILLSVRGTTDKLALVTENRPNTLVTQNLVGIRPKKEIVNSNWLFEYLISPVGLAQLASFRVGTTIAQLPIKALEQLKVPKIPLEKQTLMIEEYQKEKQNLESELSLILDKIKQEKNGLYKKMGISELYIESKI
ncbi:N-6 DNA methylase [Carnobacterium maltaromaticum]|uniref:N-6 DNA methylase n=1 Tax=Carnobacterium maltaromaticum TaxID=2751 RepID=UPI0039B126D7